MHQNLELKKEFRARITKPALFFTDPNTWAAHWKSCYNADCLEQRKEEPIRKLRFMKQEFYLKPSEQQDIEEAMQVYGVRKEVWEVMELVSAYNQKICAANEKQLEGKK